MTVIAATAAPSVSPTSSVSGQGSPSGFDALLAVVSADEAPHPKAATADSQGAAPTDKPVAQDESAAAADADPAAKEAETSDTAGQAEAAALAAATLVAAMVPQAEQTFSASAASAAASVTATATAPAATPAIETSGVAAATAALLPQGASADTAAALPDMAAATALTASAVDAAAADLPAAAVPAGGLAAPVTEPEGPVFADAAQAATVTADGPTAEQAPKTDVPAGVTRMVASLQPAVQAAVAAETAVVEPAALPVVEETPEPTVPMAADVAAEAAPVAAQAVAQSTRVASPAAAVTADPKVAADSEPGAAPLAVVQPAAASEAADEGMGQGNPDSSGQPTPDLAATAVAEAIKTPEAPTLGSATATPIVPSAVVAPSLRAETRGSPETVAQLSADILKKLDAQTTRFDVALTPEGLGKVDVRIEIGRNGALTAHMQFDTVQAAAELRGKAGELRNALAQAGFTLADNALRFDVSSQGGGQNGQNGFFNFQSGDENRRAWSGKAFQSALDDELPILSASDLLPGLRMAETSGLDIRI